MYLKEQGVTSSQVHISCAIQKKHSKETYQKKDKTTKVLQGNLVIERGSSPKFKLSNSLLVLTSELRSSQTEKIET